MRESDSSTSYRGVIKRVDDGRVNDLLILRMRCIGGEKDDIIRREVGIGADSLAVDCEFVRGKRVRLVRD